MYFALTLLVAMLPAFYTTVMGNTYKNIFIASILIAVLPIFKIIFVITQTDPYIAGEFAGTMIAMSMFTLLPLWISLLIATFILKSKDTKPHILVKILFWLTLVLALVI